MSYNANYIFTDNTARDDYFTANPGELAGGLWICVNGISQQYLGSAWIPKQSQVLRHEEYAIGDICINITGVNPAVTKGYGTWAAFGVGKVLIGLDSGNVDIDAAEETGGNISYTPAGTNSGMAVGNHAFTQPNAHVFTQPSQHAAKNTDNGADSSLHPSGSTGTHVAAATHNHNITAYTHSGGGVDAHAGGAVDAHGSYTNPTFTGTAAKNLFPFIVVHFWKRTA